MLWLLKRSGWCCLLLPSSSIKDVISKPKQVGEVTARWKDTNLSQTCLAFWYSYVAYSKSDIFVFKA